PASRSTCAPRLLPLSTQAPRVGAVVSTQCETQEQREAGSDRKKRGPANGAPAAWGSAGGSAAVAVGVAGKRAFDPVPGRARGLAGILPFEAGVAAALLVFVAQVRLDLVEIAVGIARPALVTGAVGRRVIVVAELRLVVALLAIVLAPVGLLDRRVHALAHGLAGQAARDRADRGPDCGAHRSGERSRRGAGHAAGRRTDAGTNRMRTRRTGDGIAVRVMLVRGFVVPVVDVIVHGACSLVGDWRMPHPRCAPARDWRVVRMQASLNARPCAFMQVDGAWRRAPYPAGRPATHGA